VQWSSAAAAKLATRRLLDPGSYVELLADSGSRNKIDESSRYKKTLEKLLTLERMTKSWKREGKIRLRTEDSKQLVTNLSVGGARRHSHKSLWGRGVGYAAYKRLRVARRRSKNLPHHRRSHVGSQQANKVTKEKATRQYTLTSARTPQKGFPITRFRARSCAAK